MALFKKKTEAKKKDLEIQTPDQEQTGPTFSLPQVDDASAYRVIAGPHITEKASILGGFNKYVFKVSQVSNKIEIKQAIEKLYKVKVDGVAIISLPAKTRRVGGRLGKKAGFKKAIVTLAEGNKIEIAG